MPGNVVSAGGGLCVQVFQSVPSVSLNWWWFGGGVVNKTKQTYRIQAVINAKE